MIMLSKVHCPGCKQYVGVAYPSRTSTTAIIQPHTAIARGLGRDMVGAPVFVETTIDCPVAGGTVRVRP